MLSRIPWWRLFIIFVAYLLVGAVLGLFVRFFGIPYAWSFFGAVPVVAIGVYIYFNHQRTEAWGLLLSGIIGVAALMGIARGLLLQGPTAPDGYPPDILDDCVIQAKLAYCYGYGRDNRIPFEAEGDIYLNTAYMEVGSSFLLVEIAFGPLETQGGLWGLSSGQGAMTGDQAGVLLVDESRTPMVGEDGTGLLAIPNRGLETANPYMFVRVPFQYTANLPATVTLDAEAAVVYRDADGAVQNVTLSRTVEVIALDLTIIELDRNYNDYLDTREAVERFPTIPGMIAVVVVSVGAMVWLVRLGALVPPGKGNVVELRNERQNTGLNRLGVVVMTLMDAGFDVLEGDQQGVYVDSVAPQGPARKAGIRRGDILIEFDGRAVRTPEQLGWAVVRLNRGQEAAIKAIRNGDRIDFTVKV